MNYLHPDRPRLASGLPSWLTAPRVALPRLCIRPLPCGRWELQIMVNSSWKTLVLPNHARLQEAILDWLLSPEAFVLEKFNTVPSGQTPPPLQIDQVLSAVVGKPIDAEEFGI